jgi:hypothetical protein
MTKIGLGFVAETPFATTLNLVRGITSVTISVFALITLVLFGVTMDVANFPGANIEINADAPGDDGWPFDVPQATDYGTYKKSDHYVHLHRALSVLGAITCGLLVIQSALHGAYTVSLQYREDTASASGQVKNMDMFRAITIVWTIIAMILFIWSGAAWYGMCDKFNAGLGHAIHNNACNSSLCEISFGGMFASYAVAVIWFRIPSVLIQLGLLEHI